MVKYKYGNPDNPSEWQRWYFQDILETHYNELLPREIYDFVERYLQINNLQSPRLHLAHHPIAGYALIYNGKFVWREKDGVHYIPQVTEKEKIEIEEKKPKRKYSPRKSSGKKRGRPRKTTRGL